MLPNEISVALEVFKSLNAAGRSTEDAKLYAVSADLLMDYLSSVEPAKPPEPMPARSAR